MRKEDLPELGAVRTGTPCKMKWDDMEGDDVKRFCGKCARFVWNFSELTSDEARALLVETEGRLCGRIFTRADGTVMTKDCPSGLEAQRRKRIAGLAAATALGVAAGFAAALATRPVDGVSAPPPQQPPIASANVPTPPRVEPLLGLVAYGPPPAQKAKPAKKPLESANKPRSEMTGDVLVTE